MKLSGQKTIAGLAAICAASAMLALPVSYKVPAGETKLAETTIYLNEVYFFVPQGNVMVPACALENGSIPVPCDRFPIAGAKFPLPVD